MLAAAAAPGFPSPRDDEGDDGAALRLYYTGNGLLNRGLYDLAAEEYRRFLEQFPEHEKANVARYGLGVSLYRLDDYDGAIRELTTLRGRPNFRYVAEVHMILGRSELALERHAEAAASFRLVVEDQPDHDLADDAAALLAESLYHQGGYEQVGDSCRLLISKWPESPFRERAELFWGLAEMARERFGDAAQRFGDLRARFPDGTYADQAALLEAQCLHRSEALPRAVTAYRHVVETAADRFVPDAMYGLGALLHEQRDLEAAGDVLDQLITQYPKHELHPAAVLLRGRVWFDLGDFPAASRAFEQLEESDSPFRDDAAYWLAKCDLREGHPDEAADHLGEALESFKKSELRPEMTFDRAVAQLRAGDDDEAIETVEGFLDEFPGHDLEPDALQLLAAAHHQQARYPQSLAACRRFVTAYPQHDLVASVAFLAAENEFLEEQYGRAAQAYEEFLDQFEEDEQAAKAGFRLGMARYHLGDFDAAQDLLEEAASEAESQPAFETAMLALGDGHFQQGDWVEAEEWLSRYLATDDEDDSVDDALLKLGLARQRQEKLEPALVSYERLLDEFPESPHRVRATFEKGQALAAMDRDDEAAAAFEVVAESGDAGNLLPFALNHLGVLAMQEGAYPEAAAYFDQTVDAGADAELADRAMFRRGRALLSAEMYEDAAAAFGAYRDRFPDGPRVDEASAYRAIALSRGGQPTEALAEISNLADALATGLPDSLVVAVAYEQAWCLRAQDRPEEAMDAYRSVLEKPEQEGLRAHALLELAELQMNAEQYDQASELLDELQAAMDASEDAPADLRERALYRRGLCAYRMNDHRLAGDLLEQYVREYPKSDQLASASLLCGESLYRTGDNRRAVGHLTRVIEGYPDDETYGPALLRQGECLAQMQRWPESEQAFRTYLERFAESDLWFQAQFGIGWARENQQRHSEAVDAYRKVVDRHQGETAARAQFQIGECLFAQKRREEAIRELLKVDILYAYPDWSAAALYEAGRCFQELGQLAEARKQFRQVRTEHGETKWAKLSEQRLEELSRSTLPGH
jgi:TolA-binding protein